jgi:putative membrane protein
VALLSTEEKQRVEAAIASAESTTAGELVVAVVRESTDWALPRAAAAVVTAVGMTLGAHRLDPTLPADWMLVGLVPLAAFLYAVWGWGPLLRLLVSARHAEVAARRRAQMLFSEHGLYATREHTGVLILVSEKERRVVILGDRGVDALVGAEGWSRYVRELGRALGQGRAADGLVSVVADVGAVLARHFPRRADDTNEIPNAILEEH